MPTEILQYIFNYLNDTGKFFFVVNHTIWGKGGGVLTKVWKIILAVLYGILMDKQTHFD